MTVKGIPPGRTNEERQDRFGAVLGSEWIKFRTVRGWVIGLAFAVVLCAAFTFLTANGSHEGGCTGPPAAGSGPNSPGTDCYVGHPFVPTGPSGAAVADAYYVVDQPLSGNGTITARVSSLTGVISTQPANVAPSITATKPGLAAWAKAGILLTPNTKQGSPYAAIMATGSHGVRWQYNYTHDKPGLPGPVTAGSPRWLRLTRTGGTLSGYDSTNGTTWTEIGTTHLSALPVTVNVGVFVTSPVSFQDSSKGAPTQATATFDLVSVQGGASDVWHGQSIGTGPRDFYPTLGSGAYHRSARGFVVTDSGDIAPGVGEGLLGTDTPGSVLLVGLIVGLLVLIVVSTMFMTSEYRRGLIRTTLTATPYRGRVLAAKAAVMGAVAFVTGAVAAIISIPLGAHLLTANGNYVFPVTSLTDARIVVGSAGVLAVTAVAVVGLGAILRKSAGAVTAGIVVFVLPFIVGSFISVDAEQWLFRLTPAAGLAVLEALPYSAQVSYPYTFANGYYPMAPWAGFLVLCAYVAAALAVATTRLRRADA